MADSIFEGSDRSETFVLGSGAQEVNGGARHDRIISYGDAGEPDPAQTGGAEGRQTPPVEGDVNDILTGGSGGDRFEFRALLNATEEVKAQHTGSNGAVNWRAVAGENDDVHNHWVEGWGADVITDYSKAECDHIVIRGHTVEVASITYGEDDQGTFSLITVISQQGNGGAGGANTATGAHDEDPLGTIKVYGDKVEMEDLTIQVNGVFDGIDQLEQADKLAELNGGSQSFGSRSNNDIIDTAPDWASTRDHIEIGEGAQTVEAGANRDTIVSYSDAGEPDPAQTEGDEGRVNAPIPAAESADVLSGGQGGDIFKFNFLLNAKQEILDKYTRDDGSINWRGVAGENDNVHDHWVQGIGEDTILDFSNQDGDKIILRGHTVELASITYGEDEGGDFSLLTVRSQQGDNGGAHDEDPLGSIKVYGDKVTEDQIKLEVAGVFDGIDELEEIVETQNGQVEEAAPEVAAAAEAPEPMEFSGSNRSETIKLGSGQQSVDGNAGSDRIISYGDGGEPDPAQTDGAAGRVNAPIAEGTANDEITGGSGRDIFEFRALLNAKAEVIAQHTNKAGVVNWRGVAGENDDVHNHWVEGWGEDTITDYTKAEGDKIIIRGHTVEVAGITYGEDEGGSFSLIRVISQQGNGGAGGANTATGAHDEDPIGTIKVYGDKVEIGDLKVQAAGVFDGIDQLEQTDKLADYNGGSQEIESNENGAEIETAPDGVKTTDYIRLGEGAQTVDAGAGRDKIALYSDAGEPDPAQTEGAIGRQTAAVDPATANDDVTGGQGKDTYFFNLLLNATDEVKAQHTRSDGSINWRGVAGENDDVHSHWVEGIGNDIIRDYSNQDGDQIIIRGHTVEIASITYGEDEDGDYSLIALRSQQGNGGAGGANTETGAHDEDPLGTIKVYGDKVTEGDINLQTKNVFDGVDKLGTIASPESVAALVAASAAAAAGGEEFEGSNRHDTMMLGSGQQSADGNAGGDRIISYADAGEPDPAQTDGATGRVNPPVAEGSANDTLRGGSGGDRFEFRALLNAKQHVIEEYTREDGRINWRGVAGENDQVHDHWVEGWGEDTILDYTRAEGDKIIIRGHTVEVADITYGEDEGGSFSLIRVISQQGNGGAGGANTATGAHDEDPIGTIKVYGDKVTENDLTVQANGVFDGIDQLIEANKLADLNGGSQEIESNESGTIESADAAVKTYDYIRAGEGAQDVNAGAGRDTIYSYSDAGEPDPAQTAGATGRQTVAIDPAAANDEFRGGQGKDKFVFNLLLDATDEVKAQHTRADGSINWRGVAGENDNVHDHWVNGIGDDTLWDYSNQDGDQIIIRGHTVEIASITYGEDENGDFSLIELRSQQGNGGAGGANTATGAHDEDSLGSIRVYGDKVAEGDIKLQVAGVFDGTDKLETIGSQGSSMAAVVAASAADAAGGKEFDGTNRGDTMMLGSGQQSADGDAGCDRIISYADAGEPDPAQTEGAIARVNPPVAAGAANDELKGGTGGDRFEFRALLNAKQHIIEEYTREDGRINWRGIAGENDNVHDHWVEGWGEDTILDFSKAERDKIIIRGHTVEVAGITYGEDEGGSFSLIRVISQQGNGGAGGANTATGAHDEDPIGTIKVYGDKVTGNDLTVQAAGVFDGIDQLVEANERSGLNGGSQEIGSRTSETIDSADPSIKTYDYIRAGEGAQIVNAGAGRDKIVSYSDAGEPDPAQTEGAAGRVTAAIDPASANDEFSGGQGRDEFKFNFLVDAKDEVKAQHTRSDGSINWRGVAGENDNVHDHWVNGIGDDIIRDFSNQDGDKIVLRGHTVEIASITYGEDENGDFSLISVRSQQGNGGAGGANTATGAHDEDPLGTIKVYGDKVTEDQIKLQAAGVFDGIDMLETIGREPETYVTADNMPAAPQTFTGSDNSEIFALGAGQQTVSGGTGWDRIISYGDDGEPDPAQTDGATGRVTTAVADGASSDTLIGGEGGDRFEFRALLNAKQHILEEHTREDGRVNWRGVAGENDEVHGHWVEGWGDDTILDYSKDQRDKIIIRGHTVEVAAITYGADALGAFSLIKVISQQGNGGAGGINTATGAHDEDPLGTIKVYGDTVTLADLTIQVNNVFDGIDQLQQANVYADYNGGSQEFGSRIDGQDIKTAPDAVQTKDFVKIGEGAQHVDAGAGRDKITSYSDGGEPDPAQTEGDEGRVNAPIDPALASDILEGGQGTDTFTFNFLLNAKQEILDEHTRGDGSINWRGVAGENENVHDHWVQGIGNDIILDYSEQDGDKIVLRGHTVEIAGIEHGEDAMGDFSLISVRSQQGDGGGAHDEDPLGSIRVYGDLVEEEDIVVQARGVFDGIDKLGQIPTTPVLPMAPLVFMPDDPDLLA